MSVHCKVFHAVTDICASPWHFSLKLVTPCHTETNSRHLKAHKLSYWQTVWQTMCRPRENSKHSPVFVWEPHPETKTSYLVKPQTDTLRRPHTHGNTNISVQIYFSATTSKASDRVTCRAVIDESRCTTSFNRHLIKTGKSTIYNLPLRKHDVMISNSKPTARTKELFFHSVSQRCIETAHHPPYLLQPLGIILHNVLELLDLLAGKVWFRWRSVSLERVGVVLRATGFRLPAGASSGSLSLR